MQTKFEIAGDAIHAHAQAKRFALHTIDQFLARIDLLSLQYFIIMRFTICFVPSIWSAIQHPGKNDQENDKIFVCIRLQCLGLRTHHIY